uniref:Uncharacterized protein n=1 Tax=Globodera rostochiensis TaxID=31243 RepID=A0A914HDJ6_GLORO
MFGQSNPPGQSPRMGKCVLRLPEDDLFHPRRAIRVQGEDAFTNKMIGTLLLSVSNSLPNSIFVERNGVERASEAEEGRAEDEKEKIKNSGKRGRTVDANVAKTVTAIIQI